MLCICVHKSDLSHSGGLGDRIGPAYLVGYENSSKEPHVAQYLLLF